MPSQDICSQLGILKNMKTLGEEDIALVVAGEERIECHKIVLAAASDVFRAMFIHDDRKEVEIKDFGAEELGQMARNLQMMLGPHL